MRGEIHLYLTDGRYTSHEIELDTNYSLAYVNGEQRLSWLPSLESIYMLVASSERKSCLSCRQESSGFKSPRTMKSHILLTILGACGGISLTSAQSCSEFPVVDLVSITTYLLAITYLYNRAMRNMLRPTLTIRLTTSSSRLMLISALLSLPLAI